MCACFFRFRRERQATDLIVDLLQDKPRNLPTHLPPGSHVSPKFKPKQRSMSARTLVGQRKRSDVTQNRSALARARSASPLVPAARISSAGAYSTVQSEVDHTSQQVPAYWPVSVVESEPVAGAGARTRPDKVRPIRSVHSPAPPKKSLEWSAERHVITYAREDASDDDVIRDVELDVTLESVEVQEQRAPVKPQKPYKPKPFTELVRLRRPEVTRKERERK